jgi:hypothetical protein
MATNHVKFDSTVSVQFTNSYNGGALPIRVTKLTGPSGFLAYVYQCHLNEDNDGAANAYGWDRPGDALQAGLQPLENHHGQQAGLANAASPWQNLWHNHDFSWVGVYSATPEFAQRHNLRIDTRPQLEARVAAAGQDPVLPGHRGYFPVVQQVGPTRGYYVSQANAIADSSKPAWEQARYVDAAQVPYAVLATRWASLGVGLGDYGLAIRPSTGASCGFFFGDTGAKSKVGECSRALVRTLSPTAANADLVTFLVFPGTASGSASASLITPRVKFEFAKLWYADPASVLKIGEHFSSANGDAINAAIASWGYKSMLIDI